MARRGSNEGTIGLRQDGRWQARVSIRDVDGRRVRRAFYGRTRAEVQEKLTTALRAVQQGMPIQRDERQRLGEYLEAWLGNVRPTIRPSTFVSYAGHCRLHIVPTLGRVPLAKLTPQHVRGLLTAKLASGLSPRTVGYSRTVLRMALGQAFRDGLLPRNVVDLVSPPRSVRHEISPLDADGARRLLASAKGSRLEGLYTVAVALGLRQGEALGLRWSDVDLESATLRVGRTLQRVPVMLRGEDDRGRGTRYVLSEPKTAGSRRSIALPSGVVAALREHRIRQLEERVATGPAWQDWNLVFATTIGTPLDARNVTRAFEELLRRADLPRMRFHDLRHSAASILLAKGVHPRVVMDLLGHSTIAQTMNTYSHVIPALRRDAAERMDEALSEAAR